MKRQLDLIKVGPRRYRLLHQREVTSVRDYRFLGMVFIATALTLFVFVEFDFNSDPMLPLSFVLLAILGIVIISRSPRVRRLEKPLELDLRRRILTLTGRPTTNGSGRERLKEITFDEISEFLFAMKDTPVDQQNPRSPTISAFAVHLRTFDGEVFTIIDSCIDHDGAFRVAHSMAKMVDVGVKQVGKGWKVG